MATEVSRTQRERGKTYLVGLPALENSPISWHFRFPCLEQLPRQIEADEQPARLVRSWVLQKSGARASTLRDYRSRAIG